MDDAVIFDAKLKHKMNQTQHKSQNRLKLYLERVSRDMNMKSSEILSQGQMSELALHADISLADHHHAEGLSSPQVQLQLQRGEYDLVTALIDLCRLFYAARLDQIVAQLGKSDKSNLQ